MAFADMAALDSTGPLGEEGWQLITELLHHHEYILLTEKTKQLETEGQVILIFDQNGSYYEALTEMYAYSMMWFNALLLSTWYVGQWVQVID